MRASSRRPNPLGFREPERVRLDGEGGGAVFRFEFASEGDAGESGGKAKSGKVLADFAYNGTTVQQVEGIRRYTVGLKRLRELAAFTGPVFGIDNEEESALAWSEAVIMAQYAIQMQMVLNGHEGYAALDEILLKTIATPVGGGAGFKLCYCFANASAPQYAAALAPLPQVRRVGQGLYTIATWVDDEPGARYLCVAALESDAELSAGDFLEAVKMLVDEQDEGAFAALRHSMAGAGFDMGEESMLLMSDSQAFVDEDAPVDAGDRSLIEAVRSTLVSLHVSGVEVDMFRQAGEPLMQFPCYLSYLWYEFAVNADWVRVGFCEHCGRGFNLQNWRGRMKRVCPRCKDAATNQRNKERLVEARRLFIEEGLGVPAIAARLYSSRDLGDAADRVRHGLATYPALKRQVKADPGGSLAKRCREDGVEFPARKSRNKGDERR